VLKTHSLLLSNLLCLKNVDRVNRESLRLNTSLMDSLNYQLLDKPTQEELFLLWIAEAILAGFILDYTPEDEIDAFVLFEGLSYQWIDVKIIYQGTKRETEKLSPKTDKLLEPTRYTPDGVIIWNDLAKNVLFNDLFEKGDAYFKAQFVDEKWVTILDVKAPTGTNRMADLPFSFTRKMMWMEHKLYVNKVMICPPKPLAKNYLFSDTWTPGRYFLTDKMTKERSIPFKADTAEQFLKTHKL